MPRINASCHLVSPNGKFDELESDVCSCRLIEEALVADARLLAANFDSDMVGRITNVTHDQGGDVGKMKIQMTQVDTRFTVHLRRPRSPCGERAMEARETRDSRVVSRYGCCHHTERR